MRTFLCPLCLFGLFTLMAPLSARAQDYAWHVENVPIAGWGNCYIDGIGYVRLTESVASATVTLSLGHTSTSG